MDEYNLANAFLDPEAIQNHVVDIEHYQKIPFAQLAGLGGIIAELIPQFRTITETTRIPMEGIFQAINPKTGEVMPELMFKSRQQADAYVGSMMQNGKFDQAAFRKLLGTEEVKTTVAAINPATLMIAAGIMAMSKKLDRIEEAQRNMMRFLEKDKESKLRGNLRFLLGMFKTYESYYDNSIYKTSVLTKALDIKQDSEQNIESYRSMLSDELKKKKFLVSRRDVKNQLQKVVEDFSNYRLAIYLFAFASYLEIILMENFGSVLLNSVSDKIRDDSFAYVELYTAAYTKMENLAGSSLESGAIKGAAVVSQGLGKVIEKIPIVERGQLDENLIAAGKKLEVKKDESIDDLLEALRSVKDCQVKQFIDLIETVNELHNGEPSILVDSENVFVQVS